MTQRASLRRFSRLCSANLPAGDTRQQRRGCATLFAKADKPQGSLGRMEDIAAWLAAWRARAARRQPAAGRDLRRQSRRGASRHFAAAGDGDRRASVELFAAGGAAINQICLAYDLGLKVFDLALDLPTGDITAEAALDERGCAATMAFGMEAIAGGIDLLCIGDMGIGNTTVAAAIFCALFGGSRRRTGSGREPAPTRRDRAKGRRRSMRPCHSRRPPRRPAGSAAPRRRPRIRGDGRRHPRRASERSR